MKNNIERTGSDHCSCSSGESLIVFKRTFFFLVSKCCDAETSNAYQFFKNNFVEKNENKLCGQNENDKSGGDRKNS